MKPNFQRMIALIDEVFATRKDPEQLQVNEKVIQKLEKIHPSTLSEFADENGPAAWILVIPTSVKTMQDFVSGKISEGKILEQTLPGEKYEAIYLCSATVLPEYRGKGLAMDLSRKAIQKIKKDNPIKALYVWPFTKEGDALAKKLANKTGLEL